MSDNSGRNICNFSEIVLLTNMVNIYATKLYRSSPRTFAFIDDFLYFFVVLALIFLSGCGWQNGDVDRQIYEQIKATENPAGILDLHELDGRRVGALCVVNLSLGRAAENTCLETAVNRYSGDLDEQRLIVVISDGGDIMSGSLTSKMSKLEYVGRQFPSYCLVEPKITYDSARVIGLLEVDFLGDLVSTEEACNGREQ